MKDISVIILAKNSDRTIEKAITSAWLISNDVWVVDSGSEDNTLTIASKLKARILHVFWEGYGRTRNTAAREVKHDIIFCIDSDEEITPELARAINALKPQPQVIYGCKRINLLGDKKIHYGEWGNDRVYRLYNRHTCSWSEDEVHETLMSTDARRKTIEGALLHYTAPDIETFAAKQQHYAQLSAEKYLRKNKKAGAFKTAMAPVVNFVKNYFLQLGFLDGKEGLQIAKVNFDYTRRKYQQLKKLKKPSR